MQIVYVLIREEDTPYEGTETFVEGVYSQRKLAQDAKSSSQTNRRPNGFSHASWDILEYGLDM